MTTKEAEAAYLIKHLLAFHGNPIAIHNPHNKTVEELPVIYGFNNGGSNGWLEGVLMSQDGVYLGGHICSNEGYMPRDLGILEGSRPDRHEDFRMHYPGGYRMEFVENHKICCNDGLKSALDLTLEKEIENQQGE